MPDIQYQASIFNFMVSQMRCVVKMYGLPEKITVHQSIEILLKDAPCLGDIITALRDEIPSLAGEVLHPEEDRLANAYTFNINGKFYTDFENKQSDHILSLKDGDSIALLPLSQGG